MHKIMLFNAIYIKTVVYLLIKAYHTFKNLHILISSSYKFVKFVLKHMSVSFKYGYISIEIFCNTFTMIFDWFIIFFVLYKNLYYLFKENIY